MLFIHRLMVDCCASFLYLEPEILDSIWTWYHRFKQSKIMHTGLQSSRIAVVCNYLRCFLHDILSYIWWRYWCIPWIINTLALCDVWLFVLPLKFHIQLHKSNMTCSFMLGFKCSLGCQMGWHWKGKTGSKNTESSIPVF